MSDCTTRRARSKRAAALALVLVTGQLSTATHLLFIRHSICPFDGEFVDAAEGGLTPIHAGDDRLPVATTDEARRSHEGHGHCVLAGHRRDRAGLVARVFEIPAPPQIAVALRVRDARDHTSVALHRIAPKQSPPA